MNMLGAILVGIIPLEYGLNDWINNEYYKNMVGITQRIESSEGEVAGMKSRFPPPIKE